MRESGVRLGLGCDNCSGSDVQSVFQAMKMFCLFAAVSEPEPGRRAGARGAAPCHAGQCAHRRARRPARRHQARLQGRLILIDLNDVAYLPYNSAARQLVYTEAGRGVESVMVDGRMVIKDRKVKTIDEDALRREVDWPHAALHRRL